MSSREEIITGVTILHGEELSELRNHAVWMKDKKTMPVHRTIQTLIRQFK